MDEREIMDRLLVENAEFKRIFEEHRRQDKRLAAFRSKSFLTEQEKVEESELKKRKLVLKDKMYQLMAAFRKSLWRAFFEPWSPRKNIRSPWWARPRSGAGR